MTTIDISAELAARGHGAKTGPRFGIDRSYVSEAEGFRAWCAEPAHDAALSWIPDSTGYSTRVVWQLTLLLAARLPQIKVIYRIGDWANGNPVWADFGTANDGTVSRVFNAPTWAAAGPGVDDTNWWLPGTAGYYVVLPASRRYTPWGSGLTKGFVGVDLAPGTWRPASNMSMIQQSGTAKGTIFRLGTDGRITIITSPDGTATDG